MADDDDDDDQQHVARRCCVASVMHPCLQAAIRRPCNHHAIILQNTVQRPCRPVDDKLQMASTLKFVFQKEHLAVLYCFMALYFMNNAMKLPSLYVEYDMHRSYSPVKAA